MSYVRRTGFLVRVTILCLLAFACAAAEPAFPDTPAGRVAQAYLTAFNADDRAVFVAFAKASWPAADAQRLEGNAFFRRATGGLDLRKVEDASTPTKFVALVQERVSDQFGRMTIEVDPAEPHHITAVRVLAISRPAEFALPHLKMTDLVSAWRAKLQRDVAADRFAGAVLVAQDGKPVFAQAYGLADIEHKIPNTLQTRFRIGSMNKMFTAVATLQLAQAGKLRLEDPLGKYLPNYPNDEVATKVTIAELLSHTGGTGDFFGPEFEAHRLELRTLDDYVRVFGKQGLAFQPGSRFGYSNYGFILLGAVIEKVSGQSYYDYVREHVYGPAGMTSTGSEPESTAVPNRSIGYMDDNGKLRPNTDTLPYRGTSAGGGYSTVEDLLRFANALHDHKLLDARYTELLTTGKVDMSGDSGRRYAYGFGDEVINGTRCIGHNGGAPGMNGDLAICGRYVVVALANRDPSAADNETGFVTNRLPEK